MATEGLVNEHVGGRRLAFTTGFLDGDSCRPCVVVGWAYRRGWKAGRLFRRLRGGGE